MNNQEWIERADDRLKDAIENAQIAAAADIEAANRYERLEAEATSKEQRRYYCNCKEGSLRMAERNRQKAQELIDAMRKY